MRGLLLGSLLLSPLLLSSTASAVPSTTILISEFRTRGPNGPNDEFIEIHNKGTTTVNVGGWQLRVSDDAGGTASIATIASGITIPAGRFYLFANKGSQGYSGSVVPNATYTTAVPDDGGIAILDASNTIIDQVGMFTGTTYFEGVPLTPMTKNVNQSYERNDGGCSPNRDTDDNSVDFRFNATTSFPQNAAVVCNPCGGVKCIDPLNTQCFAATGTCKAGTCSYKQVTTGTACDDGDPCTTSDSCDVTGDCVGLVPTICATPPTAFCSDPQTLVTYGALGLCVSGTGCTYTPTNTTCPFGCNAATHQCSPPCTTNCSTPPPCFDAAGTCVAGTCVYAKSAANTGCDDGNACTNGDKCDGSGTCVPGAATKVDDGNPCTADSCDPTTGNVSNTPVTDGTNCDDGDLCNGVATCTNGTCTNGAAVTCTTPPIGGCYGSTGTCASLTGACSYPPLASGTSCDDGAACTTNDACDGNGACAGTAVGCTPPAPTCVAGDTASRVSSGGQCNTTTGACTFQTTDTTCANGCDTSTGLCKGATVPDGGAGGAGGAGGTTNTGGTTAGPDASAGGTTSLPDAGNGGTVGNGGTTSSPDGGLSVDGGGGLASGGAATGSGGAATGSGGTTTGSGGTATGTGGAVSGGGTAGLSGSGGSATSSGGASGAATGGSSVGEVPDSGTGAFSGGGGGCGCSVPGKTTSARWPLSLLAVALAVARRRRNKG